MRSHEKRRAKLALGDEDCQYDGADYDEARSLWKKQLWHGGNSMVRTSRTSSVCLVYLVHLVYLVCFVA